MKPTNKYSTSARKRERIKTGLCVLVLAAVLAGGTVELIRERQREAAKWTEIPMANQRITWEGAGYNGIWGSD